MFLFPMLNHSSAERTKILWMTVVTNERRVLCTFAWYLSASSQHPLCLAIIASCINSFHDELDFNACCEETTGSSKPR